MWFITDGIISTWFIWNIVFFVVGIILAIFAYKYKNNESGLPFLFFGAVFIICSIVSEILNAAIKFNF